MKDELRIRAGGMRIFSVGQSGNMLHNHGLGKSLLGRSIMRSVIPLSSSFFT